MIYRSKTRLTATAGAHLSVVPLSVPLIPPPHLVAPGKALLGDFIAIFGGICYRPDLADGPETHIEVVFKQGVLGPEDCFLDELSDTDAARLKEITTVPFGGFDHDLIVRQAQMVEEEGPYQIHLVQFHDAILYVHPRWLQGRGAQDPDQEPQRPLMIMMEGARSLEAAERCLEKTKRYMNTFRMALPSRTRAGLNRDLALPNAEDFFANGDADHAYVTGCRRARCDAE